jgi:tetratricopeptide (TPR) repeat protein
MNEAEKACRESQAVLEKVLGPEHPNLGESYVNLATLIERRGKIAEAEANYRRSLEVRKKSLGPKHPQVGQTLQLMGLFYLGQGRLPESEAAYREALALFRGIDPKHFEVGKCLNGLALIASRRGRYAEAEQTLIEVDKLFMEVLGEKHPFTWQLRGNRAIQISLQGRNAEAEALVRPSLARLVEITGPESNETADSQAILGEILRRQGRYAEAAELHRKVLATQMKIIGDKTSPLVAIAHFQLGADLAWRGEATDGAEARRLLDHALEVLRPKSPPPTRLPDLLFESGRLARIQGDAARAKAELTESARLFTERLGADDERTRAAKVELARAGSSGRAGSDSVQP